MTNILIIFFLLACFSSSITTTPQEENENIIDEIVNVCKTGGPKGLISWMKQNKERVKRDNIIEIAQYGT